MIEVMRREIARAAAGARHALRAIQSGLVLTTKVQRATGEGLAGEKLNDMELFQHFGFTSAPPAGTELVVLPLGGRTSASVVIATEHGAFRLQLGAKGEVAIYNQWGDFVHLREDRRIHVKTAVALVVEAPLATFTGNVDVAGTLTAAVDAVGGGKSLVGHVHGGVLSGGAQTGAPA